MEIDECIENRRSIRSYLDKKVHWEKISQLLDAAHLAPSSGNIQNWRFIVITDDNMRNKIASACLSQKWMTQAPVYIVVCSENTVESLYEERGKKYSIQNCAAAIENILLKAIDLSLGTCWIGSFNDSAIKPLLEIPENVEVEAIITLGYPTEKPISKRHKLEELTFFEKYGNRKRDTSLFPLEKHKKKIKKLISKIKNKREANAL